MAKEFKSTEDAAFMVAKYTKQNINGPSAVNSKEFYQELAGSLYQSALREKFIGSEKESYKFLKLREEAHEFMRYLP